MSSFASGWDWTEQTGSIRSVVRQSSHPRSSPAAPRPSRWKNFDSYPGHDGQSLNPAADTSRRFHLEQLDTMRRLRSSDRPTRGGVN